MGSLTTGAEVTLPSRRIASCFSSALPVTSPSLLASDLSNSASTVCPAPWPVERDGCGRHDAATVWSASCTAASKPHPLRRRGHCLEPAHPTSSSLISKNDPAGRIAASPRCQQPVDSPRRCHYADDPARRPWCTPTVRYGAVALCPSCNAARSTLGKGQTPVPLPAGPAFDVLGWIATAHRQAGAAEATLAAAVTRVRQGGAAWSVIGAQLGVSRQRAQQRFTSCLAASKRPLRRGHCLEPAHPTSSSLTSKPMGCLTRPVPGRTKAERPSALVSSNMSRGGQDHHRNQHRDRCQAVSAGSRPSPEVALRRWGRS